MPDLSFSAQTWNGGGQITPRIGGAAASITPDTPESMARRSQMTQHLFNTKFNEESGEGTAARLAKYVGAAGIDIADMVTSISPGVERGDVWSGVRQSGGMGQSLANFAERNKSGVELTSGLITAVATAGLADAYLVPLIAGRVSGVLGGTKIYKMGETFLGGARAAAINGAAQAAAKGEMATVLATGGGKALLRARVAEGIGRGAVQEGAVSFVLQNNETMWSDNTSTNLMFAGLGIGLGGALGALGARFEMRQIANSDDITKIRARASDPVGYVGNRAYQPDASFMRSGADVVFKESTIYTGLQLQARSAVPAGVPGERATLLTQESVEAARQAQASLTKIVTRGHDGVPGSAFRPDSELGKKAFNHLNAAGHEDPTVLLGIDSIGLGNPTAVFEARISQISNLKKSQEAADQIKARNLEYQEPLALVNKSWMPDSKKLRELADFDPAEKVVLTPTMKSTQNLEFKMTLKSGSVTLNESAAVKGFSKLRLDDQQRAVEGLKQLGAKMRARDVQYILPKNHDWIQLDFALDHAKRGGKVEFTKFAGFQNIEDLESASLRLKAKEAVAMSNAGQFGFWERMQLNLPLPSSVERIHDGSSDILATVLNGMLKNPKMTAAEARQVRTQMLEASDLREGIKGKEAAVTGDLFNFNRTESGEWQPILTGYGSYDRIKPELLGKKEHLMIAEAENKVYRFQQLLKGDLTNALANRLMNNPSFQRSMELIGLDASMSTGVGRGRQGLGGLTTQAFKHRDNAVISAAIAVREDVDRVTNAYLNDFLKNTFQGKQNELASLAARDSKVLVDQVFSVAGGWDLKKGNLIIGDKFGFELAETPANAARLGRPVNKGEALVNPKTGKEVVLDDRGLDFFDRFQAGARKILRDQNAVRAAQGLPPVAEKNWYVPAPPTKGKIIGFTIDANGNAVPGGAVIASTREEFEQLRKARVDKLGPGESFHAKDEIESTLDLWDRAGMDWVDPGFIGAKKTGQTGALFGDEIRPTAMQDSLQWLADRVKANAQGTVRNLYDQQLAIARARAATEDIVKSAGNYRSIYDEYEATILGIPIAAVKPGQTVQVIKKAEDWTQALIDTAWPAVKGLGETRVNLWTQDLMKRLGIRRGAVTAKSFEELSTKLGPHMPYKNVMEYMEQNHRINVPPEVREITSKINSLTASMLLRWFEIPNAAMNMLGLVTNMPSILRSPLTPLIGTLNAGGKKVGVVDSYKIMSMGFADMFSKSKQADLAIMARNGDTTQSVAELSKQLSLIDSRTGFQKVMLGDSNITLSGKAPRSLKEGKDFIKAKGIDGMISLATDVTEGMSRTWAHLIGLRLADMNGIVGTDARHSFARQVADSAIANYNPLNKPELFQSAFGSMFGLFTSYMQQYNQRMFRWMEAGDYRSVGRQIATQSAMFGAASVPGYNALDWFFQGSGENPEATLTDQVYAKFGPKVGSVIAHGGVQELPKILGLDEGIALYSRGDTNLRAPTLDPTRLMAGLNMVSSVATGTWEIAEKAINPDSELSMRFVTETIARNLPNRTLKGVLGAMANDGQEVDANGAIVSESKTWLESGVRMLGARSTRQQGEIEAYYANSAQRRRLAGRFETLREETRAAIRGGTANPVELFTKYVERGGQPAHFSTWIKDQISAAQDSRGIRQISKSMNSPAAQLEAWRYDMR